VRAKRDAGRPDPEVRAALAALAPDGASDLPPEVRLHAGRSALRLAERTKRSEDVARAHALLEGARVEASAAGDASAESWAAGYLARLYEMEGRSDEALALSRRAAFLAQGSPEALYRWSWQTGRLLAARGELPAAIEAYRASAGALDEIRHELVRAYGSGVSFREDVAPVYLELADLLLRSAPAPSAKEAHEARLLEVRETVEQLKAQELRDYFRDDCVDQVEAKVERLDQVSKQAAVIYPVLLSDRLELLVTLPGRMLRVTVPEKSEVLEAEVVGLRRLLEKRTTLEFLPHAQRLYDLIVRPWVGQLEAHGIGTLVFVPDGLLRTIPMGALHDGEKFLIERYALAVTPGLSLTDPRPLERTSPTLLLGGLSQGVQGFSALPHVAGELSEIQSLYGGDVLLDQSFRAESVERSLAEHDVTIVHLASHAKFGEEAQQSFVLTWDGRLELARLGEVVGYARFRERPIELLALSACETAEGSERAALGLAGVAVKAGARSALGTLWSVNDEAAARVMTRFYQELRDPKLSKAEALRRAQLALLADANHRHPYFWSPFLLINNWL
jgi:CHAT domain-containing protein